MPESEAAHISSAAGNHLSHHSDLAGSHWATFNAYTDFQSSGKSFRYHGKALSRSRPEAWGSRPICPHSPSSAQCDNRLPQEEMQRSCNDDLCSKFIERVVEGRAAHAGLAVGGKMVGQRLFFQPGGTPIGLVGPAAVFHCDAAGEAAVLCDFALSSNDRSTNLRRNISLHVVRYGCGTECAKSRAIVDHSNAGLVCLPGAYWQGLAWSRSGNCRQASLSPLLFGLRSFDAI